jgi:hypothetical protein
MFYEHYTQPVISRRKLLKRVLRSSQIAGFIIIIALAIGIIGYHILGPLPWIDSLLEASMILGGMGAVAPMTHDSVKLFASFYALFSGFVVLTSASIILAPFVHRLLHKLHVQDGESNKINKK